MVFGKRKRQSPRQEVNLRGSIDVLGRASVRCVVVNLSESGALIELRDRAFVPKQFALTFGDLREGIQCEVVRTTAARVAVRFVLGNDTAGLAAKRMIRKELAKP